MKSVTLGRKESKVKLVVTIWISLLVMLTACSGGKSEQILEIGTNEVESIIVYTYDLSVNSMERHWVYRGEDLETVAEYFDSLEGEKLSEIPSSDYSDLMYGVEINEKDTEGYKMLLISNNYAITKNGEYYRIDGDEVRKICTSLKDSLNPLDSIVGMVNHRALSLVENQWRTEFMLPSEFSYEEDERVKLVGDVDTINRDVNSINFAIVNKSDKTALYGARVRLEVELGGSWYQIDDMTIGSKEISWVGLEYILESGQVENYNYKIDFYQPLPNGKYRILKEYNLDDDQLTNQFMTWEFEIID